MPTPVSQLRIEWIHDDVSRSSVTFDASVRESFESSGEATEHAVERGAAISDHVKPNADTLTVEAVITNSPMFAPDNQADGVTGSVRALQIRAGNRPVTANVLQFSSPFDRVRTVDRLLRTLREAGQLLKVYTGLRVIENVVIQRYSVERSGENGNALHLTLDLKVLRIASTARVPAPRRVQRRQNRGSQPTAPVQDPESVLHALRNRLHPGSG